MEIKSDLVKELREKTGAGMMDCKKALIETECDFEKSVDWLRAKGLVDLRGRQDKAALEGVVGSYIHSNDRLGVIVELNCETDFVARNAEFKQLAKDLAMHVAAANPKFLKSEDMDQEFLARETEIYKEQLREEKKPEHIIATIVSGKLKKLGQEVCLLEQKYVKNPDITVQQLIQETILKLKEKIEVKRFYRIVIGEK